jgi:high-affinity nickel-transport protein
MRNDKSNAWALRFLLALVMVMGGSATCFAHPMGNFSVNHYSKITVSQKSIEILYLVDMAEIPTYQEIREYSLVAQADDPSIQRYLERMESILKTGLSLSFENGRGVHLETIERRVTFADGAGGLPTMKIGFVFRSQIDSVPGVQQVSYADNNFPGRSGWKEIVVVGGGAEILNSSAPATDRSHELTTYSSDALNSPPQLLTASISYRTAAVNAHSGTAISTDRTSASLPRSKKPAPETHSRRKAVVASQASVPPLQGREDTSAMIAATASFGAPQPTTNRAQNTPRSRFTDLISTQRKLSFWFLLSAALIAAGLGALHALEPGHGKTIVAAYLVGSRGTARHAVLLGIVVTAAHTSGVFLLGAVTLYASRYVVPEQLYPWLGAISGLSVAGLGIFTFLRHKTGETGEHSHAAGDRHSHGFLSMFKRVTLQHGCSAEAANLSADFPASQSASSLSRRTLSLRELCVLGITGGIVPCPAALVVLLSAFSLHRIGFGLFLITAFSLGLAAVLVVIGISMVYTKRLMAARVQAGSAALRYLPILSSAFMVVLGLGIAASAIGSLQFAQGLITRDKLVPFVTVVLLGLFLGMRHSTDPDHVVAVSTIVSRQGSIRSSAAIGLLWGLGHTLTIFFIGSAIIIFGVVIPPRVGLSMEFCVALMLILLGVLNLTGVMSWITNRLTPGASARAGVSDSGIEKVKGSSRIQSRMEKFAGNLGVYQTLRPLVVGLVHGLAGSAAVALLVLSTIKSPLWSTAYLLVFGFGTMLGMMVMTAAISLPVLYTGKKFFSVNRHLTVISGMASVAFGMFLVYQIGFVDGLFSAHVHWIPQ